MIQSTTTYQPTDQIRYTIDGADIITSTGGAFDVFAAANDAPELQVVGRPIWEFLGTEIMNTVYKNLFAAVRSSSKPVNITFRCDSKDTLRFMNMHIQPEQQNALLITSSTMKTVPRARILASEILYRGVKDGLPMCSHCNKIYVDALEAWLEIDAAVAAGLISDNLSVSFDLCQECQKTFKSTTAQLSCQA